MKKYFSLFTVLLVFMLSGCDSENIIDTPTDTVQYEITWIDEEGNTFEVTTVTENQSVSKSYEPTDTDEWDCTFEGWSETVDGAVLTNLPVATKDATYYAIVSYVKLQYTVSFEPNDGSAVTEMVLDNGVSITELDESERSGYNFVSWYTDSALTTQVTLPFLVTEDITLYASWEEITYDLTWYDESGNRLVMVTLQEGRSHVHMYDPVDTDEWDYTLDGWSTTSGGAIIDSIPAATEDAEYYAIVSAVKQQYTVTFEPNDGSAVTALVLDYGTSVTELDESERSGYNFVSWNTDSALTTPVTLPFSVTEDITLYASWNERVAFGSYLQILLDTYTQNPYNELPDSMLAANYLVDSSSIVTDYSSFVQVSDINYNLFGEQWEMVLGNMDQTRAFSDLLSVVEVLSTSSVVVYNNFLDSNPANTEYYQFDDGIYTITIEVDGDIISYSVDYTGTVPVFGDQVVGIELTYNFADETKTGRIQIGNDNVLQYTVSEDKYEFGISYLGIRDAYFELIYNEDGSMEGAIFEYLTFNDYSLESAAQFIIDDSNVYVIGNKASGLPGFTGTIVEVYDVTTGDLIGYEVQETLSLITFNTLWFKLEDQTGITNIKVTDVMNGINFNSIYVNDGTELFQSEEVGGLLNPKQASRRYDIEMRTMYCYTTEDGETVKVEVKVPMLFVQEEMLDDLESNVVENNSNIDIFTLDVTENDIILIQEAYLDYVPLFQTNKENISYEDVRIYLGLST